MSNEEILEGNKLIAEFMGGEIFHPRGNDKIIAYKNIQGHLLNFCIEAANYHCLWDWLMPVVEKMENMGYCFTSDPFSHELIEYGTGDECVVINHEFDNGRTKIEEMYLAVLKFIHWYNQQSK